eukprot:2792273-Pyramimonas_sp.AAC.1
MAIDDAPDHAPSAPSSTHHSRPTPGDAQSRANPPDPNSSLAHPLLVERAHQWKDPPPRQDNAGAPAMTVQLADDRRAGPRTNQFNPVPTFQQVSN